MEYFKLNNGNEIPQLCFGPGMLTRGMSVPHSIFDRLINKLKYIRNEHIFYNAILSAINIGFRFIDYSAAYGREDIIKKAISDSSIDRKEFYLTTRISNKAQFSDDVKTEFYKSLDRFGVDYIDVLMFHWPVPEKFIKTWENMIELKDEGLCKNIGVSNCNIHHIETLLDETNVLPSINQVEVHPLFTQKPLLKYCNDKGILIEAYTPLARMDERITRLPLIKKLTLKYNKSVSQLILRWHIQNGIIPVFRSLNKTRQQENYDIFDFKISKEDMLMIDSININSRLRYDPDNCDFSIL